MTKKGKNKKDIVFKTKSMKPLGKKKKETVLECPSKGENIRVTLDRINNLVKELQISNLNISILEKNQSDIFWKKVKNLEFFYSSNNSIIRIVIPPSECVQLLYQFSNKFKYYLDWGGSLIWMESCELTEEIFDLRSFKLGILFTKFS